MKKIALAMILVSALFAEEEAKKPFYDENATFMEKVGDTAIGVAGLPVVLAVDAVKGAAIIVLSPFVLGKMAWDKLSGGENVDENKTDK